MNHKLEGILYMIGNEQIQSFNHTYQAVENNVAQVQPPNEQSAYVKLEPQDTLRSPIGHPDIVAHGNIDNDGGISHTASFKQNNLQYQFSNQQVPYNYDFQRSFIPKNQKQHQQQILQSPVHPDIQNFQSPFAPSGNFQIQDHYASKQNTPMVFPNNASDRKRMMDFNTVFSIEGDDSQRDSSQVPKKKSKNGDHVMNDGENELKQMAFKASELPLSELTAKIKSQEKEETSTRSSSSPSTENKESQRQIFGMVWLLKYCESSSTAVVPRNRIYAKYVQVCADNGLTPLSPASFGKLVRILFPNLTTRRLGMRGHSKYHYCGIKLLGETDYQVGQASTLSTPSNLGLDSPVSANNPITPLANSPVVTSNFSTPSGSNFLSEHTSIHSLRYVPNIFPLIEHSLYQMNMGNVVNLPSIYPYLPKNADSDIADTLYSLYKVHCNSIFESLRYMQMKKLFSSFASFNSILTAPVFKLYTSESTHEWVRKSDLIMYRNMVKMLSKLYLQSIPSDVLQNLKLLGNQFLDRLTSSLQGRVSTSFMMVKLNTARSFVMVVTRLTKVIETGQLAARILNNESERNAMWNDWMKLDIDEIVLREVTCTRDNADELLIVLKNDIMKLLGEKDYINDLETADRGTPSVLHGISSFISELPRRFKNMNPRLYILVSNNILTTCLREISLKSGQSFGAWWIVRCWVDEFMYWCFELGGFLQEEFQISINSAEQNIKAYESNMEQVINQQADAKHNTVVDLLDGAYGLKNTKDENLSLQLPFNYSNLNMINKIEKLG